MVSFIHESMIANSDFVKAGPRKDEYYGAGGDRLKLKPYTINIKVNVDGRGIYVFNDVLVSTSDKPSRTMLVGQSDLERLSIDISFARRTVTFGSGQLKGIPLPMERREMCTINPINDKRTRTSPLADLDEVQQIHQPEAHDYLSTVGVVGADVCKVNNCCVNMSKRQKDDEPSVFLHHCSHPQRRSDNRNICCHPRPLQDNPPPTRYRQRHPSSKNRRRRLDQKPNGQRRPTSFKCRTQPPFVGDLLEEFNSEVGHLHEKAGKAPRTYRGPKADTVRSRSTVSGSTTRFDNLSKRSNGSRTPNKNRLAGQQGFTTVSQRPTEKTGQTKRDKTATSAEADGDEDSPLVNHRFLTKIKIGDTVQLKIRPGKNDLPTAWSVQNINFPKKQLLLRRNTELNTRHASLELVPDLQQPPAITTTPPMITERESSYSISLGPDDEKFSTLMASEPWELIMDVPKEPAHSVKRTKFGQPNRDAVGRKAVRKGKNSEHPAVQRIRRKRANADK